MFLNHRCIISICMISKMSEATSDDGGSRPGAAPLRFSVGPIKKVRLFWIPLLDFSEDKPPFQKTYYAKKVVLCVWSSVQRKRPFFPDFHAPVTAKGCQNKLPAFTRPLTCAGNTSRIVNTVLSVMPKHTVCMEPCMGSTQAFFRKPKRGRKK